MPSEAPNLTHGHYPDPVAPPAYRRRSSFIASGILVGLAVVAAVGAFFPFTAGMHDPVAPWAVTAAFVLLAGMALASAALEIVRARRADTLMAFTVPLAVAMTWASVTNGWYVYSPFLVTATLMTILALAHRAIARDELRHVQRDDTHAESRGPLPSRAGPEMTGTQHVHRGRGSRRHERV